MFCGSPHVLNNTFEIKMADSNSAFAFTSVCVSAHLLSAGQKVCVCVKNVEEGRVIILFPHSQGCAYCFMAICQIQSFQRKLLVRWGGWSCRQSEGQCDTALEENSGVLSHKACMLTLNSESPPKVFQLWRVEYVLCVSLVSLFWCVCVSVCTDEGVVKVLLLTACMLDCSYTNMF